MYRIAPGGAPHRKMEERGNFRAELRRRSEGYYF